MQLFVKLAKELAAYEKRRELIIRAGRDILRDSKRVIFLCHEGKYDEAAKMLTGVSVRVQKGETQFQKPIRLGQSFSLYSEGSWAAAMEEYLEAWFFYNFMKSNKLVAPKGCDPSANVVVGALADTTGEVVRMAVQRGGAKDLKALEKYRRFVAEAVAFMAGLYLSGQIRMKFDQARKNLKRIEEIIYEVKIRI